MMGGPPTKNTPGISVADVVRGLYIIGCQTWTSKTKWCFCAFSHPPISLGYILPIFNNGPWKDSLIQDQLACRLQDCRPIA
jgi:hypothetical protein